MTSGDLQLALLALLDQRASHGYELIKSLEELSDGYYVPSPGMIYPALTYLEEIGYADVETEGTKKRYRLTDTGKTFLTSQADTAEQILRDLREIGARMDDARRAFLGEFDDEKGPASQSEELRSARRTLRTMLRGFTPTDRSEDKRIAEILHRTIARIQNQADQSAVDPDDLLDLISRRRSMGLSRLKPDPVDRRLIEQMLEAANWAPSHGDTEPWRFQVFMGSGREKLAEAFKSVDEERAAGGDSIPDHDGAHKRAFAAPVWISVGMTPELNEDGSLKMSEHEELMAVASAVQNLHLMAQAFGLAGMWHSKGVSVHPAVARWLGLEAPSRLLGFFMCGWPVGDWLTSSRRPLSEKVTWVDGD